MKGNATKINGATTSMEEHTNFCSITLIGLLFITDDMSNLHFPRICITKVKFYLGVCLLCGGVQGACANHVGALLTGCLLLAEHRHYTVQCTPPYSGHSRLLVMCCATLQTVDIGIIRSIRQWKILKCKKRLLSNSRHTLHKFIIHYISSPAVQLSL